MIFAQIKNGKIQNTILLDNPDLVPLFGEGFDAIIRIDQLPTIPGPGWDHNGDNDFTPPQPEALSPIANIFKLGDDAEAFGQRLISDIRNENIALGITQLGLTNHVRKTLFQIADALRTGSLFDAIYEISILNANDFDEVILTPQRLLEVRNRIETYLNIAHAQAWDQTVL